jgi:hypothetical protein
MTSTGQGTSRPPIPEQIKLEVRRRCGFGCVICGLPLYEYDHIVDWAIVKQHVAEQITLLCDRHHREKTNGLLSAEQITSADQDPFNFRQGVSKPYDLHYDGDECETIIGSTRFTTKDAGQGTLSASLVIDGNIIVGFVLIDGHLLLHLQLYDEYNIPIATIYNNELIYSTSPWDIKLTGRNLVIRAAERSVLVDIQFEVPNRIVIRRARVFCNGVEIVVQPDYVLIVNSETLLGNTFAGGFPFGLVFGSVQVPQAAFQIKNIPRYANDTIAAIRRAKRKMAQAKTMQM